MVHEHSGLLELEVYQLSRHFKVVEVNLFFILNPDHFGQMDVIKFNIPKRLFLESSDFLADDDFLEIDKRVLGLDILFLFCVLFGS